MVTEGAARGSWTPLRILAGLAVIGAMYFARQVLIPVAVALLVGLLLDPVVQLLERWKLGRIPSVLIVLTLTIGLLGWMAFIVTSQVTDLAQNLPQYKDKIHVKAETIGTPLGGVLDKAYDLLQDIGKPSKNSGTETPGTPAEPAVRVQIVQSPPTPWEVLSYILSSVVRTLGAVVLITILVAFVLIYHADLRDRVVVLFGVNRINITTQTINEAATSVSRYLLTQSAINAVYGVLVGGTLLLLGVPNSVLWGFLAAVLRFIPYVGPWLGFIPPFLLALAVFDGWSRPFAFLGIVACLEILIANVLEPVVYGKRVGLSPLAVIVAAVFWTWLWGNAGLLLALPLTVCLEVLGRHVPSLGFLSTLLARETDVEPHVRFYQRMIGMNLADAAAVVESARERKSVLEVYDEILIPAMVMVERDFQRGELEADTREDVFQGLEQIVEDLELDPHPSAKTETSPPRAEESQPPRLRLVCLPASSRADELACRMLAHVLSDQGIRVDIISPGTLTAEKVGQVDRLNADVACVSTIASSGRLQAWHLCKRLRRGHEDRFILAGVWGAGEGADGFGVRFQGDDHARAVGSLSEALKVLVQLVPEVVIRNGTTSQS